MPSHTQRAFSQVAVLPRCRPSIAHPGRSDFSAVGVRVTDRRVLIERLPEPRQKGQGGPAKGLHVAARLARQRPRPAARCVLRGTVQPVSERIEAELILSAPWLEYARSDTPRQGPRAGGDEDPAA